jgi:hypothetical protein
MFIAAVMLRFRVTSSRERQRSRYQTCKCTGSLSVSGNEIANNSFTSRNAALAFRSAIFLYKSIKDEAVGVAHNQIEGNDGRASTSQVNQFRSCGFMTGNVPLVSDARYYRYVRDATCGLRPISFRTIIPSCSMCVRITCVIFSNKVHVTVFCAPSCVSPVFKQSIPVLIY